MEKTKINLGIIAGIRVDTKFGVDIFKKYNFSVIGKHLFEDLVEQTRFEIMEPDKLTKVVLGVAKDIEAKVDAIVIYCNTLASAIDMAAVIKSVSVPVITPHDVYRIIAKKYRVSGLMAMSGVSSSKIEKTITQTNKNSVVISYSNPEIANDVEKNITPEKIIESRGVLDFVKILERNKAEVLILGCTHFPYFYAELRQKTKISVIEPSEIMRSLILVAVEKA